MQNFSKYLIYLGIGCFLLGVFLHCFGKYIPFGNLPGDFSWGKGHVHIYFPFTSSIILSIILSLLLWLLH